MYAREPAREQEAPGHLLEGTRNPWRFQGRRWDCETGWGFFRLRYLDAGAGRWVSRDPLGIWGDPGQLGNAYSAFGNDPVNGVDPWGLEGKGPLKVVIWVDTRTGVALGDEGRAQISAQFADKFKGEVKIDIRDVPAQPVGTELRSGYRADSHEWHTSVSWSPGGGSLEGPFAASRFKGTIALWGGRIEAFVKSAPCPVPPPVDDPMFQAWFQGVVKTNESYAQAWSEAKTPEEKRDIENRMASFYNQALRVFLDARGHAVWPKLSVFTANLITHELWHVLSGVNHEDTPYSARAGFAEGGVEHDDLYRPLELSPMGVEEIRAGIKATVQRQRGDR